MEELTALERSGHPPDLLVLDLRDQEGLPPALGQLRRRFGRMGVVIVASQLDPALMLEAMRAGVNEFVTEPLSAPDLRAAIERVVGTRRTRRPRARYWRLSERKAVSERRRWP